MNLGVTMKVVKGIKTVKKIKQRKLNHKIIEMSESQLTPIHFKLTKIKDSKAECFDEKCIIEGCFNKKLYCPIPCGHFGLCERCIYVKDNNQCDVCKQEPKNWISIYNVDETNKCTLCCDEHKRAIFLPCRHFFSCLSCVDRLRNQKENFQLICPYCNSKSECIAIKTINV